MWKTRGTLRIKVISVFLDELTSFLDRAGKPRLQTWGRATSSVGLFSKQLLELRNISGALSGSAELSLAGSPRAEAGNIFLKSNLSIVVTAGM